MAYLLTGITMRDFQQASSSQSTLAMIIAGTVVCLQLLVVGATYLTAPDYLEQLVHSKLGLTLSAVLILWELVGFWFASRSTSSNMAALKWVLVLIFCVLPLTFLPLLGPTAIAILKSASI